MLEATGIRVALDGLDGSDGAELAACRRALAKRLRVSPGELRDVERRRRSIDARKRSDVHLELTLRASLAGGEEPSAGSSRAWPRTGPTAA